MDALNVPLIKQSILTCRERKSYFLIIMLEDTVMDDDVDVNIVGEDDLNIFKVTTKQPCSPCLIPGKWLILQLTHLVLLISWLLTLSQIQPYASYPITTQHSSLKITFIMYSLLVGGQGGLCIILKLWFVHFLIHMWLHLSLSSAYTVQ